MDGEPEVNGVMNGGGYELDEPQQLTNDIGNVHVSDTADAHDVNQVVTNEAFREGVEEMVIEQLSGEGSPICISGALLKEINRHANAAWGQFLVPVADIRGADTLSYSKGEKAMRCKLASCHRLVNLFGWCHNQEGLITARLDNEPDHFLVQPFGMMNDEVTAASLVKVKSDGQVADMGCTNLGINRKAFTLHSAVFECRSDARCVIHIASTSALSVSVMKCGLLPLSPEAISLGEISYYKHDAVIAGQLEKDELNRSFASNSQVLFLLGAGVIVIGETVEEAFHNANCVMTSIEAQMNLIPLGLKNLHLPSDDDRRQIFEALKEREMSSAGSHKWKRGELEFEALMRQLDNAGYRTGYTYHDKITHRLDRRDRTVSEGTQQKGFSLPRQHSEDSHLASKIESIANYYRMKGSRADWLTSPNFYHRVDRDERGGPQPRKISRWVSESEADRQPPRPSSRNENPNRFAPQGRNPRELIEKVREIRKEYFVDTIKPGPQSRVLEGVTWEEARRIKEMGADDGRIKIAAASKSVIQKDHQHEAFVYKNYASPNPFENITKEDIENYKREVQGKFRSKSAEPPRRFVAMEFDDTVRPESHVEMKQSYQEPVENSFEVSAIDPYRRAESAQPLRADTVSPTKSTSSGEGLLDERSSRETSPTKGLREESFGKKDKKKKRGFRMPSFSKKKDKQ